ncbi:MAG: tRNA (adenosine(37)-N6)-threonylcarbamoyltransferase complex ATPase subunit type 1 TsaE [Acidimicrobiales bacterium]
MRHERDSQVALSLRTSSPARTMAVGAAIAAVLEKGDVVLLIGSLGAGKTTLVKGLARALGVTEEVTSPTFTLCQSYEGRLRLSHADLWRLETLQEVVDLALDEDLDSGGVLVVEWGEGADELFGGEALVAEIEIPPAAETDRIISFSAQGARSADRLAELAGRAELAERAER